MEALTELCDIIAENPKQFSEKLAWICGRCPQTEWLLAESPRVSRSHLNAVLAVARIISKNPESTDNRAKSAMNDFLSAVPASLRRSFWPHSFPSQSISSFYCDFLSYLSCAADLSPEFATEVARFTGEVVIAATSCGGGDGDGDPSIAKAFLVALSQNFPSILQSDGDKLITMLLDQFVVSRAPPSPKEQQNSANSDTSSAQSSPVSTNRYPSGKTEESSPGDGSTVSSKSSSSVVVNGGSIVWKTGVDQLSFGFSEGSGGSNPVFRQQVASFEDESIESLEKQEIAFRLITHILEKVKVDSKLQDQVRFIAKRQLQSMSAFLKSRKRDWNEQGPLLKTRVNAKLSVYQAVAKMKIKSLVSLETDGKTSKRLVLETLALLLDAADACLTSVWRKMKACEELFGSLLSGIAKIAVERGGQPLRVLLIRLKPLVLAVCAQPDQGALLESVFKTSCEIIESGWAKDRAPVDTFVMGLASSIRERNDYEEQVDREKQVPAVQLNVIRLLADLNVAVKKPEVADMILPLFIESLEEGDASAPSFLRLQLLDAVSRIATLGFEKSYRETVVLMTRSYLSKLSSVGSVESKTSAPEATTERIETLPAGFLTIANGLADTKLRSDYRHRLLSLCSDVGLAAESKSGGSGVDFLGPLLPAVAEICSDFDPTLDVEPSLLKLFRNLWFYIALFGLAPPILKASTPAGKSTSNSVNSGSMNAALQAVGGPYMWNTEWVLAVQRISQGTPPLVVSSVKWLEDELELNALHNPGSRRGNGNEKVASTQRLALSTALGGRVDVASMNTISGVKATYLLAVAFLEIIRFISNGGILNGDSSVSASRSAFSCVFEYLKTPNLTPAVSQCLTAIVHRSFETAVSWLEDRISLTGKDARNRELTTYAHACFLIKSMSQRDEHVRNISVNLLTQLRDKFPQVLWHSSCLDSLLFSVYDNTSSTVVNDPAWTAAVRSLYQKVVREWIIISLSYAPCTSQGIRTANIPAVMAAAAAASGANLKVSESFNLEVLGTGVVSATVKCNHAGEIAGMRRLYNSIGGFQSGSAPSGFGGGLQRLISGAFSQAPQPEDDSFNEMLIARFVRLLQQFVNTAEKGGEVDKTQFRETCSQATALLLSNLGTESKTNVEGFSQLLRLLCWCPAYISTPDAMETGIFIWTWLVSAAPQLVSLVLAELVDAWIWTIDTKRGLFASDVRYSGPAAKLRPHLAPGEPEGSPESDPVDQIVAHRLWLGFLIDRFEDFLRLVCSSTRVLSELSPSDSKGKSREIGNLIDVTDQYHPVWGEMDNYTVGKEKRKQLLLMLCQHEADRLDVWAQPISSKDSPYSRLKISSEKWTEHAKTAFSVDPRIALSLASRFPANAAVKSEVTQLVQTHIVDLRTIPQALPYFVTPKNVEEDSALLQQLPHWAACSITQALEFLTPAYKGHPRVMAYVLRVLESYPPDRVTFFMPQLVQSLRYDEGRLVEGYLLRATQRSDIFAHILIWHLQGESVQETPKEGAIDKNASFQEILPQVRQHIIDGFSPSALDMFTREFDFFDKVTSISGVLFPLPKEERRAGIRRELEKIEMQGDDLYLPTAPSKLVRGIRVDSGIPLQSAAKVPIMITFNVVDRDGDHNDVKPQACIFKVGDDCRQDVLALQVISLLRDIFQAVGLNLYLFPYGVLPTGDERGIIEVVPNTRSRSQMGETTDGGLYEIFQQDYGPVGSATFETARENFLISSAGYAVASLLLQPKDRHNGNLLFDDVGRLVHIDFGFILETSPGGNMRFESAHFKLSHEMTQLLDPSGVMKSKTWHQFVSLCVKGYLAARRYMDGIISTVQMMLDSGLPCFSRGDPIGNLRKRFHPEMSEREAAHFMIHVCTDAYNKWTTAGYDLIQYLQQGIEK
ncbi:hypothetical protein YC2023_075386 [Brassica napus]